MTLTNFLFYNKPEYMTRCKPDSKSLRRHLLMNFIRLQRQKCD